MKKSRIFSTLAALAVAGMALASAAVQAAPQAVQHVAERACKLAYFHVASLGYGLREKAAEWVFALQVQTGAILRAFPGAVGANLGFGVVGEWAFAGPTRAQPGVLKLGAGGATAADLVVGRWFTIDAADGQFIPGGAGAIGGVLMCPKNYSSSGTVAGGALAPTMTLLAGTVGEFATMGEIVVALGAAVAIGAAAKYNTTTGVILSGAPGAGEAAIPNAKFTRYANAAAGLAVLTLTN